MCSDIGGNIQFLIYLSHHVIENLMWNDQLPNADSTTYWLKWTKHSIHMTVDVYKNNLLLLQLTLIYKENNDYNLTFPPYCVMAVTRDVVLAP